MLPKIVKGYPTIDNYEGIRIELRGSDHNPPHLHAQYDNKEVQIDVRTDEVIEGRLPPTQMRKLRTWLRNCKESRMEGWQCDQQGKWSKKAVRARKKWNLDLPWSRNDFIKDIQLYGVCVHDDCLWECWFRDGSHKLCDMKPLIESDEMFKPLLDKEFFQKVYPVGNGMIWNEEIDTSEYWLYKTGKDIG